MLPSRELTWHSPRVAAPVPRPSRAAASRDEPRAPLFYGLDLPKGTVAFCSPLALVRSTENNIVLDYRPKMSHLISCRLYTMIYQNILYNSNVLFSSSLVCVSVSMNNNILLLLYIAKNSFIKLNDTLWSVLRR